MDDGHKGLGYFRVTPGDIKEEVLDGKIEGNLKDPNLIEHDKDTVIFVTVEER